LAAVRGRFFFSFGSLFGHHFTRNGMMIAADTRAARSETRLSSGGATALDCNKGPRAAAIARSGHLITSGPTRRTT